MQWICESTKNGLILGAGWLAATLMACSGAESTDDAGSGGPTGGGAAMTTRCLDENQQTTSDCAVAPTGAVCERSENPACGGMVLEEVSVSQSQGPCLRLVSRNDCGQTLYSRTCIEHDDGNGGTQWQCWWSTTLPGFEVDLGQCGATGNYAHWWGLSSGALDVVDPDCDPSDR